MPHPADADRYPVAFMQALDRAIEGGSIVIPTKTPSSLRFQFYGFFRGLRKAGMAEKADMVMVTVEESSITLKLRDLSTSASEVEAALKLFDEKTK